jgi:hypothetical protein
VKAGDEKIGGSVNQLTGVGTELANLSVDQLSLSADLEDDTRIQGLSLPSLQPAQLAEGGEGTARVCSLLGVADDSSRNIRLRKSVLEKRHVSARRRRKNSRDAS